MSYKPFKMKGPSLYRTTPTQMKGDLDKDGRLSDYEANRQSKIDESMNKKSATPQKKDQDFVPAYPGADISESEYKKMQELGIKSEAEYAKYKANQSKKTTDPKKNSSKTTKNSSDTTKKGKIIYKDGKKYYQAADGTLHTGQVSDYEREKAADEANAPKKP